jgi:2-keto-4-pentenoate hydratase/2-oxohepta-3-ene-1,7-dioic acid hydratase in catechol pathway
MRDFAHAPRPNIEPLPTLRAQSRIEQMKLVSYLANGKPSFGVVVGDGVVTMNERLKGRFATLRDAIAGGAIDEMRRAAEGAKADHPLAGLAYLPTIPNPEKIMCVGINYKSHAAEHGAEVPKMPNIFLRFINTMVPHGGAMIRPKVSTNFDFEGELALVIGKAGRHIKRENALDYIAGYSCFCDATVRDFTKYSLAASKNFVGSGPLGPWMVTADEIPDPTKLTLTTRLNGAEMQRSGTDMLIHDIPAIISFCSMFTPLTPGDIIATGTPDGIGAKRNPPVWMKAGDVLEVEVTGVGTLRNTIADEA